MSTSEEFLAAVKGNDAAAVEQMLATDPDLAAARDAAGVSALMLAHYHGHASLVAALRSRRADLDPFEAAALGDRQRLAALLDADGGLANAVSPDGFPIVTLAAYFGRIEALALLLERGARVNVAQQGGWTPLHQAAKHGPAELVELLLEHDGDVGARSDDGQTPLALAEAAGHAAIVALLRDRGAGD